MGGSLGLTAAIGGALLAIILFYAVWQNSKRSRGEVARTEEATKDFYANVDREDKATDPDPGPKPD